MRKLFLSSMAFAAIVSAMTLTSCSDDDNENGGGSNTPAEAVNLSGTVEGTMTLVAGVDYHLTGTLTVPDGATLEIQAGTTIKAAQGFDKYILVAQGGTINAQGTATQPIIFTADVDNATSGHWGGLIINGALLSPEHLPAPRALPRLTTTSLTAARTHQTTVA